MIEQSCNEEIVPAPILIAAPRVGSSREEEVAET